LDSSATQGINLVFGRQKNFSFSTVAASAIVNGITQSTTHFNTVNPYANIGVGSFGENVINGFAGSVATTEIKIALGGQGKINFADIAADSFGNALGNSIVGALQSTPDQPYLNQRPKFGSADPVVLGGNGSGFFSGSVGTGASVASSPQLTGLESSNDYGNYDAIPGAAYYGEDGPTQPSASPRLVTTGSSSTQQSNTDVAALNATQVVQLDGITVTGQREQPGFFTRLVSDVESGLDAFGKYAVGSTELVLSGVYNEAVRIAGGVASIPFALIDGVDAGVAVQRGFKDALGYTPQSAGALAIESTLAPVGQFIDQHALTPAHDFLERNLGDAATTTIVGTTQAGLEIAGLLGGVTEGFSRIPFGADFLPPASNELKGAIFESAATDYARKELGASHVFDAKYGNGNGFDLPFVVTDETGFSQLHIGEAKAVNGLVPLQGNGSLTAFGSNNLSTFGRANARLADAISSANLPDALTEQLLGQLDSGSVVADLFALPSTRFTPEHIDLITQNTGFTFGNTYRLNPFLVAYSGEVDR
jgi:hypothetical protein